MFLFTSAVVFLLHPFVKSFEVSLHTLETAVHFRGSTSFKILTSFLLLCVTTLSTIITGNKGANLFFSKREMGSYVCAV